MKFIVEQGTDDKCIVNLDNVSRLLIYFQFNETNCYFVQ